MGRLFIALVVPVAVLGATVGARADLCPPIWPDHAAAPAAPQGRTADEAADRAAEFEPAFYTAEIPLTDLAAGDWVSGGLGLALPPAPAGSVDLSTHGEVRLLQPGPSSASLFLSAVLSIGAWHLGRSGRHLHLGHLPAWYHTGCPDQIGHAVPFDLDFGALPLCCYEQPVRQRPFLYRVQREQTPRCDGQCFLIITFPRGPPIPCC